ncbi:hypothetical protein ACFQ1I_35930 [Kitasatospora arboriphila]
MSGGLPVGAGSTEGLRKEWARLLGGNHGGAVHPRVVDSLVDRTAELLDRARRARPFDPVPARQAGALLVDAHFTDPEVLARAVEILHRQPAADGVGPMLSGAFAAAGPRPCASGRCASRRRSGWPRTPPATAWSAPCASPRPASGRCSRARRSASASGTSRATSWP